MAKTNTIITIGREYGSAGRQIGYKVAEDLGIKYTTENCWNAQQKKVVSVKNFLRHMMRNLPTVFCILWLWILILSGILHPVTQICQLIIRFFLPSSIQSVR